MPYVTRLGMAAHDSDINYLAGIVSELMDK
jgi:hypothetical protein